MQINLKKNKKTNNLENWTETELNKIKKLNLKIKIMSLYLKLHLESSFFAGAVSSWL